MPNNNTDLGGVVIPLSVDASGVGTGVSVAELKLKQLQSKLSEQTAETTRLAEAMADLKRKIDSLEADPVERFGVNLKDAKAELEKLDTEFDRALDKQEKTINQMAVLETKIDQTAQKSEKAAGKTALRGEIRDLGLESSKTTANLELASSAVSQLGRALGVDTSVIQGMVAIVANYRRQMSLLTQAKKVDMQTTQAGTVAEDTAKVASGAMSTAQKVEEDAVEGAAAAHAAKNAAITMGISLLVTAAAAAISYAADAASAADETETLADKVKELNEAYEQQIKSIEDTLRSSQAELQVYSELVDRYDELNSAAELTTDGQRELNNIVSILAEAFPELGWEIDAVTGKYNVQGEAIDALIQKQVDLLRAQSRMDKLAVAYDSLDEFRELHAGYGDANPLVNLDIKTAAAKFGDEEVIKTLESIYNQNSSKLSVVLADIETKEANDYDQRGYQTPWRDKSREDLGGLSYNQATAALTDLETLINEYKSDLSKIDELSQEITGFLSGEDLTTPAQEAMQKYESELKDLDHQLAMYKISEEEYYATLESLAEQYLAGHAENADEYMKVQGQLAAWRHKQAEEASKNATTQAEEDLDTFKELKAELDHERAMDAMSDAECYARLQKNRDTYLEVGSDEWRKVTEEIKKYNQETAEAMLEASEKAAEAAQKEAEETAEALDELTDNVVEALKNQYAEMQEAEEEALNNSIEAWEKWKESNVNAIQAEIDALDALEEKEKQEEKAAELKRKRDELEFQLRFETDEYNRQQIQKSLNGVDREIAEHEKDIAREAERAALQEQKKGIEEQAKEEIKKLEAQRDQVGEKYADKITAGALLAEATRLIANSTPEDLQNLISTYAPDALVKDVSGSDILSQFLSATGIGSLLTAMSDYATEMKQGMSAAAGQTITQLEKTNVLNSASKVNNVTQNIVVNGDVSTETMQQLKESLADMLADLLS